MNTETVYHIPAHAAFSVSLVHGDITHLATSKQAALLVAESGIRLLIGLRVYELDTGDAVLVPPLPTRLLQIKLQPFAAFDCFSHTSFFPILHRAPPFAWQTAARRFRFPPSKNGFCSMPLHV